MKVITTVGTSLFTNYDDKNFGKALENREYWKNIERFESRLQPTIEKLQNFTNQKGFEACAELTSIKKLKDKYKSLEIYLIATDTLKSYISAEVIKTFLEKEGIKVRFEKSEEHIIKDLNIDNEENFTKGINNLIDVIFNQITNDKKIVLKPDEIIFNITGGYKGIIPYFSTIAQIFDYEIVYTFEDKSKSNELIEIKPLPIEIDRGLLEIYYPYLDNQSLITDDIKEKLLNLGLYSDNQLTSIGKIALLTVKNTPLSKDVFGHFIEYKVYEYFVQKLFDKQFKSDCLDFEYSKVGHGVKLGKGLSDIDIMLEKDDDIVWIEVKPISYIIDKNNIKKLLEQITKQLEKWSESKLKNKKIKKYILVIYLYDKNILTEAKVDEFRKLFEEKKINFDICYFQIKLTKSDKKDATITSSTYQTVMKDFQINKLERIDNV